MEKNFEFKGYRWKNIFRRRTKWKVFAIAATGDDRGAVVFSKLVQSETDIFRHYSNYTQARWLSRRRFHLYWPSAKTSRSSDEFSLAKGSPRINGGSASWTFELSPSLNKGSRSPPYIDQWSLILSIDMTCPVDPCRWRLTSTSNQITMNSDIKYPCAVAPLADPNLVVCQKRETITALFYFRPTNRAFVIFVCSWFPFIYAIIAALPSPPPPPPDPEVVVVVAATQWRCHMMKHISDRFA